MTKAEFYTEVMRVSNPALAKQLADSTKQIHLNKKDMLIREGELQEYFIFLLEGILRGFFLDITGKEITDCFLFQRGSPSMATVELKEPSIVSLEAETECELFAIKIEILQQLMQQNAELLWIYNALLRQSLQAHWKIKTMVCQHTAMERYQWFLREYPGLIQRVNNKYIASFLGITPVTLSRLRRVLREHENNENQTDKPDE